MLWLLGAWEQPRGLNPVLTACRGAGGGVASRVSDGCMTALTWQQGWLLSHIPGSCWHRVFVKCGLVCRQALMHNAAMHWVGRAVVLLNCRLETTVLS